MSKTFEGVIPPIVTPFDEKGNIIEKFAAREMKFCIDRGVNGLSVGGSTGEGPTLRDEDLQTLIGIAKDFIKEDQPIVCGIMRACTRDAVRAGLAAKDAGADMIMVTPTAYNVLVPNEQGMFDFYSTLSKEVALPIVIYNVIPQNTVTPRLFKRLLEETEYVIAIKQSVGGVSALYEMKMTCGDKGIIYAATDDMLYACYEHGARGAISAILAIFPDKCVEMWNLFNQGKKAEALAIQNELYFKWQCLAGNQFPIRIKYALSVMGRDVGFCRSPITYLPDEEKEVIKKAFYK